MWKKDVPGGHANIGIHTVLQPALSQANGTQVFSVVATSTASPKEGPSELVKNIVGALSFGAGSKWIQDTFDHNLGDLKAKAAEPKMYIVPFLSLPEPKTSVPIPFSPPPPFFEISGTTLFL